MTYVQSVRLIVMIQTSDWILHARVPIFVLCNAAKECAMAQEQRPMRDIPIPDLLAALTAYGLGGPRPSPRSDQRPAGLPAAQRSTTQRSVMKHIARFFDWLNAGIAEGDRIRREAYLGQSSDHCDLEYRIRELERDPSTVRGWW
jgi:hypothetical protein